MFARVNMKSPLSVYNEKKTYLKLSKKLFKKIKMQWYVCNITLYIKKFTLIVSDTGFFGLEKHEVGGGVGIFCPSPFKNLFWSNSDVQIWSVDSPSVVGFIKCFRNMNQRRALQIRHHSLPYMIKKGFCLFTGHNTS